MTPHPLTPAQEAMRQRIATEAQKIADKYVVNGPIDLVGTYQKQAQALLNMAGEASNGEQYADLISITGVTQEGGQLIANMNGPEWALNELGLIAEVQIQPNP